MKKLKDIDLKKDLLTKFHLVNILLMLIIGLLVSFIVIPPILRSTAIDVQVVNNDKSKKNKIIPIIENASMLRCIKYDNNEKYLIKSDFRYIKGEPDRNIITYTKVDKVDDKYKKYASDIHLYTSVDEQLKNFKSTSHISISNEGNSIIVKLEKYLMDLNKANYFLIQYYQNSTNQKNWYEKQGFSCTYQEIK